MVVFRQIFTPADCIGNEYAVSYHVASSFTFPNKLPSSFLKQMSAKSVYVGYLVYFLFVVGLVVIVETSAADLVQEFFGLLDAFVIVVGHIGNVVQTLVVIVDTGIE